MIKDSFPEWLKIQPGLGLQRDKWFPIYLEQHLRDRAYAHFSYRLKGVKVVSISDIEDTLESYLSDEEIGEITEVNLLIRGYHHQLDAVEIWLAIEVSAVIDRHDVERAERRAGLLRKVGYRVIPTVAGQDMTTGGESLAAERAVFVVQNGRKQHWDAALARALSV
ncbi:MAG: hypothetical protein KF770_02160 [Anaerolineae bacterium]|nr:hypothetical protein [Anaerolineae bacterium]